MTNTKMFRKTVDDKGIKYQYIAECLGLTPYGLQRKIDNKSEFKASEIYAITNILGLSDTERDAIFFDNEVI